jgi:hypothetical protein
VRSFFQWAADVALEVLCTTRPHIELFRSALEARGLAAATIDRRLSTVCGASIASPTSTGELPPTRPSTCAARPSTAPRAGGSIAPSSGVVTEDDAVYIRFGTTKTIAPEPFGRLLVELAEGERSCTGVGSPSQSHWLFPGLHAGRPLHPSSLGLRLRHLGITTMSARRAALMHLAGQLPAAVLAETLHLHPTTGVKWTSIAGGDWSSYAAKIARER